MQKKKIVLTALMIVLMMCSGCTPKDTASSAAPSQSQTVSEPVNSSVSSSVSQPSEPVKEMARPTFTYLSLSDTGATIRLTSSLENVETIVVYHLYTSSDVPDAVYQSVEADLTPQEIGENGEITLTHVNTDMIQPYQKDNSAIKIDYASAGYRVCYHNEDGMESSDYQAYQVSLETGKVNQHNAAFWGDTACGAANGTLLLQSVMPVWGDELTARMDAVRGYSAESSDYSTGPEIEYCMSSTHILNSVNRYLQDSGITDYRIADVGTQDVDLTQTLCQLLDTGRPAAVMVAYANDAIIDTYRYGHWITINAYRLQEDGGYDFRWENTLYSDSVERWVSEEQLLTGYTVMAEYLLNNASEVTENPWGIDALEQPVVESLI